MYEFDLYQTPNYGVDICPVWYYNEYNYYLSVYNMFSKGSSDIYKASFENRLIFNTILNHYNLEQAKLLKEMQNKDNDEEY